MKRIPRFNNKLFLSFSLMAMIMGYWAIPDILSASYQGIPLYILPFIILLCGTWISLVVFFFCWGLSALHTIELDQDELRVCLGHVVLRRIPTARIKTVGISVMFGRGKHNPLMFLLVLSSKTVEELNEIGERRLKNKFVSKRMFQVGVLPEGKYAGARAYLFEHFMRAPLWLEDSEENRETLRKYLTTTNFIL